jgi:hypothetical protein
VTSVGFSVFYLSFFFDLLCIRFSSPPCIGLAVVALFKAGRKPISRKSNVFVTVCMCGAAYFCISTKQLQQNKNEGSCLDEVYNNGG